MAQTGCQSRQRTAARLLVADLRQIYFRTRLADADDDMGEYLPHRRDHAPQQCLFAQQQIRLVASHALRISARKDDRGAIFNHL